MVQLSPDTRTDPVEWDGCGGYHYSDSLIYGFSHTHLSGTGVSDLCDVLLMPLSGGLTTKPAEYRSTFRTSARKRMPATTRCILMTNVDVELTTTKRGHAPLCIQAEAARSRCWTFGIGTGCWPHRSGKVGRARSAGSAAAAPGTGPALVCIRFNVPVGLEASLSDSSVAVITLPARGGPVVVKVGISAVSVEGARKNLEAEVPGWDFDAVRKQAEEAWDKELGRIEVQGGELEQQRICYTALYHSLLVPYLFNDVDGKYRGNDGKVHTAKHDVYTVFSLSTLSGRSIRCSPSWNRSARWTSSRPSRHLQPDRRLPVGAVGQ